MSKISNTLMVLKLLSSGTKYSAKDLALKLETSERMIRTYIADLEMAGIYIERIRGPYGGYVINQKISIPTITFSKKDVKQLDDLINEATNINQKKNLIELRNKIFLNIQKEESSSLKMSKENLEKYNLISKAIKEKRKIRITYFSKGTKKERIIVPLEIFVYDSKWFVIVIYSEDESDIRYLNFERLNHLTLL
mgnify:FL=1